MRPTKTLYAEPLARAWLLLEAGADPNDDYLCGAGVVIELPR